jgi:hypothetical protein
LQIYQLSLRGRLNASRKDVTVIRIIAAAMALYISTLAVVLPTAQSQPDGKSIFRFDTFGSEQLWTDVLRMQQVIPNDVSPRTALSVGLKVDVDAYHSRSSTR